MRVERLRLAGGPGEVDALVGRLRGMAPAAASVAGAVGEIVADVRARGDAAVVERTRRFDTAGAEPGPLVVPAEELQLAADGLDLALRTALELAAANVEQVARAGLGEDREVVLAQGQRVVLREVPVTRAGVYAPGGQAPYPSSVLMGAVAARVAGVSSVAVCAPPGPGGDVDRAILAASHLAGADRVYRMGGAQAIAALAYGTESVERVDVIVGPGSLYTQEAKRQVFGAVGIDGFAGPSDVALVIDDGADVRLAALDLLAQAEHGPATLVLAISASEVLLDGLAAKLEDLAPARPRADPAACVLVGVKNLEDALAVAERFAPEHLELVGPEAQALASRVRSAGCLFVGRSAGTAFGDYVAGSNHVLPTEGAARFSSGLGPGHFRRRMSEVRMDGAAAVALAPAGAALARAEGFNVHAESMEARIRENGDR